MKLFENKKMICILYLPNYFSIIIFISYSDYLMSYLFNPDMIHVLPHFGPTLFSGLNS